MARRPWTTPTLSDSLNGVPLATPIILNGGEPHEWRGPFAELLVANADHPITGDDLAELTAALAGGHVYAGGGGAAATFTVERA